MIINISTSSRAVRVKLFSHTPPPIETGPPIATMEVCMKLAKPSTLDSGTNINTGTLSSSYSAPSYIAWA